MVVLHSVVPVGLAYFKLCLFLRCYMLDACGTETQIYHHEFQDFLAKTRSHSHHILGVPFRFRCTDENVIKISYTALEHA